MAKAIGTLNWFGFIGRIVGISVGTSIFNNKVKSELSVYAPSLDPTLVPIVREYCSTLFLGLTCL